MRYLKYLFALSSAAMSSCSFETMSDKKIHEHVENVMNPVADSLHNIVHDNVSLFPRDEQKTRSDSLERAFFFQAVETLKPTKYVFEIDAKHNVFTVGDGIGNKTKFQYN